MKSCLLLNKMIIKIEKDPDFTVIGYVTDESEGVNLITNDGSSHPLDAKGWDSIVKNQNT